MISRTSRIGLLLAGIYILLCIYLIATQGLFGESFIALLLGIPWSFGFALMEYGNATGVFLYVFILAPLVINAALLYGVGILFDRMGTKKAFLIIGGAALLLIGGFFALNHYIYTQKQAEPEHIVTYRGTLSGEYVCLEHRDTSGPQTTECALGIKTDAGEYYAVDFSAMSQESPELTMGDRFTAKGFITPIELLSTDHWQKYNVQGIFSVTDSVQKL